MKRCLRGGIFSFTLSLLLAHGAIAAPETIALTGTVRDASTREPLVAANIRVLGTTHGTITNAQGEYSLLLPAGEQRLLVSMLGYQSDTVRIHLEAGTRQDVSLRPGEIVMPEVVVTSEDPAIEIIRRAIARKHQWIDRLASYEMDAFTRQILRRDTSIASITESYTRGYWQQGDTLREVITQRRQTANIQASFNAASVGRILNFNEDEIRFLGYSFVGPTSTDALKYYDYKLLRTQSAGGRELYEILMIPRTNTTPLFAGRIKIEGDSYALVGVDVQPNDAFIIPFIKERQLRYRQQFALYGKEFWLPTDIRIDGEFTIGIPGLTFPRIGIGQTSVITSYAVNVPIPDSILHKPRLVVDSAAMSFDSTYWASNVVLPLSVQEREAYASIDSSQKLEVQFRPGGITATLGGETGIAGDLLTHLDPSFNRVEGLHLGVKADFDTVTPFMSGAVKLGYGLANKLTTYLVRATFFIPHGRALGFGGEASRSIDPVGEAGPYGVLFNSVTALFAKNDYYDYYRTDGWRVFVESAPSRRLFGSLSFLREEDQSIALRSNYSVFYRGRKYRENPPIDDGTAQSLRLDLRLGDEAVPLDLLSRNAIEVSVEHSSPAIGSDFNFTRYSMNGSLSFATFGKSFLLKPTLRIQMAAGSSSGVLPRQRLFTIETASSGYAPSTVMRAIDNREFTGPRYVAIHIEHNFRSLPFLALHLPFLYKNSVEFILHGGAARAWDATWFIPLAKDRWYYEAGFGFSRILGFFRTDFTWRLSPPVGFAFTAAIATIF